jgi:hypothetical protein
MRCEHSIAPEVPYLVGGGYAMAYYTGIARNTKDLDLFIREADRDRCLSTLAAAGYKTEFFYEFWISKAIHGEAFIDILYNSGNGLCVVDDDWFRHAVEIDVHGYHTLLVPPEEQIWSKAFVQDRDRFDGATSITSFCGKANQWTGARLLHRFAGHERVLLAHLLLFGYAFPSERDCMPTWVLDQLNATAAAMSPKVLDKICFGPNLAQKSYGTALKDWGLQRRAASNRSAAHLRADRAAARKLIAQYAVRPSTAIAAARRA